MNSLDSRSLRLGDCFALRMTTAGAGRYALSSGAHVRTRFAASDGFALEVKPKAGAIGPAALAKQHNVLVTREGHELSSVAKDLSIEVGDTVLWYTSDPEVPGFAVAGSAKEFAFSSHGLKAEAIYTHAFGVPETIEWVDGVAAGVSGVIVVKPVAPKTDAERAAWFDSLTEPATIEIRGGKANPDRIEIVVGQTVFWKVWDGEGIAIVDKRLVAPK